MDIKTVDEEIKDKSIDELKELVKQQQGSIDALKALMGQLIIIVESIQPLLKERPEIDQGTVEMVDRLLMLIYNVENIRDVIPYPRTPGNCEY